MNCSRVNLNKYKNIKLNESALPIKDKREYKIFPEEISKSEDLNDHLIIFENELHADFLKEKKYKKIYFVLLDNENRLIKLSSKVIDYKKDLINYI